MLDIKFVRENPDLVDKACESRQNAHWDREKFFELDEERRSVIAEVEALQAARNSASKEIGQLMHVPAATVRTRLHRARRQLKELLGGNDDEACVSRFDG